jgi:SsrA-binding protein
MSEKNSKQPPKTIAQNKRAKFDYFLEEKFEAGLVLEGWEVKALRAGKAQLTDSYVIFKDGEAWLLGSQITPLPTTSTHVVADPQRTRKLLLKGKEIDHIQGAADQKGYSVLCTSLYWKKHMVKAEIALGKGKANRDKRDTIKEREWNIQKQRVLRHTNR